ncbi:MAG: MFS transporter [Proteobacteria bacterium]|nr:MAG: MFS transporter [Pseudomonadota bacterium]
MSTHSQFELLKQRRYLPFFLTQFFGAFNDNVFKNALIIMIAFQVAEQHINLLTNLAFGLFILPFFLFSAFAGQVADKYPKDVLIRRVKMGEIVIMLLASVGFYLNHVGLLIFVLFLMGSQSSLFGPVKYGYLPEKLNRNELMGGNGLVESSTFISILLGTILGGILIAMDSFVPISLAVVGFATLGYLSARQIPLTPAAEPGIKLDWRLWRATAANLRVVRKHRDIFLAVMGISWFWFFGSVFLAQMPNFTRLVLHGNEHVVTLLLTMFSVGIGIGSLLCEKLSNRRVEIGLVPLGALGLAIFGMDLSIAGMGMDLDIEGIVGLAEVLTFAGTYRINFDLLMIGVFGGLYIVPLYSMVQARAEKSWVSRMIAGNNIYNALFMVVAALMGMGVLVGLGWSIPQLFMLTIGLHIIVSLIIFKLMPDFIVRLIAWVVSTLIYRTRYQGLHNIPAEGGVILACNHISFMDPVIISARSPRPVRYVMHNRIYHLPILHWIFRLARCIPIASEKENPEVLAEAYRQIYERLAAGEVVVVFPEGQLTPDGHVGEFKHGIEKVLQKHPVPVVPMALHNLWGSMFSRYGKKWYQRLPRKLWSRIELIVGEPMIPEEVTAAELQRRVIALKNQGKADNSLLPEPPLNTDSNA